MIYPFIQYQMRPAQKSKLNYPLPSYHATIVLPQKIDDTSTILIDNNYLLDNKQKGNPAWIGTIAHETTHVKDYTEYAQIIGVTNYDDLFDTPEHHLFQIWTEFNARRHGHYFFRKYAYDKTDNPDRISIIIQTELPFQINYMKEQCLSSSDSWNQIYTVTQFMGRLSVWKELFPESSVLENLKEIFEDNDWMLDFFNFLDSNRILEDALNNFDKLREILNRDFVVI